MRLPAAWLWSATSAATPEAQNKLWGWFLHMAGSRYIVLAAHGAEGQGAAVGRPELRRRRQNGHSYCCSRVNARMRYVVGPVSVAIALASGVYRGRVVSGALSATFG